MNRILQGAYFAEGEELEATGISFGLSNLTKWIGKTGLSEEWFQAEKGSSLPADVPELRIEARSLAPRLRQQPTDRLGYAGLGSIALAITTPAMKA